MNRSKIQKQMETSHVNLFSMESTLSTTRPISLDHNRRVINEIIDDIFDERKGTCDVSSSQCSSLRLKSSEYSYDKRLKYWKDVLKDRQMLQHKITKITAKKPGDILYNRLATIDERDKQTVRTILDYADRMNPENLSVKKHSALPEKCNQETCSPLIELQATLPRAERERSKNIEISGLPKAVRMEMLGKPKYQGVEKPYSWLRSKFLESRVDDKREDIERVVEYYPDIENLQIIGEGLCKTEIPQHDSDIQLLKREQVCEISSESQESEIKCQNKSPPQVESKPLMYGFKVNDHVFLMADKHRSKNISIDSYFSSQPYGREVKKLMTIHNIGQKVLNFGWAHRSYYAKNSTLLKSTDNEFVFDNQPFRLYRGQIKEIYFLYQPRRVNIVKSKWVLKVDPFCFCRKTEGIVIRLTGTCLTPPEYANKLNELQTEVIDKSNLKMMRKLTTGLGSIALQIEPLEVPCPYQRTLNDVELFEQLNPVFKCDRFHDLELLKNLYKRVKKPREKLWDFKVDSLKCVVLRVSDPESRAFYFNELTSILDAMKGQCVDLEQRLLTNPEREKSRLLYVRGLICSSIDEWEELSLTLEEAFFKPILRAVKDELQDLKITAEESEEEEKLLNLLENESALRLYVLEKRVRCLKPFRDSLYMQTYTLVCNFTENIVNIIESTEVI